MLHLPCSNGRWLRNWQWQNCNQNQEFDHSLPFYLLSQKEEPLYRISIAYEKETKELAIEQKNDLSEKIKEINENLNSKKDIEEFLDEGIQKYELTEKQFN